jgi:uroporphyrinogen-III decarboxylase
VDPFRSQTGLSPHARIVERVRSEIPGARIIGFPRGAGTELGRYLDAVAVDAIGLDWTIELEFAWRRRWCRSHVLISFSIQPRGVTALIGSSPITRRGTAKRSCSIRCSGFKHE